MFEVVEHHLGLVRVNVHESHDQHVIGRVVHHQLFDDLLHRRIPLLAEVGDPVAGPPVGEQSIGHDVLVCAERDQAIEVEIVDGDIGELGGPPLPIRTVVQDADRRRRRGPVGAQAIHRRDH